MTSDKAVIELTKVRVEIAKQVLLQDVSLKVAQGELLTIVGRNGAGKSTLLKVLTKIQSVTSGQVHILGQQVLPSMSRREIRHLRSQVAQVFQGLQLVPRLTALENVLIGRLAQNHSLKTWARIFTAEDHKVATEALSLVGILHKADLRIDQMSGGERQKVAIARAVAQGSKLILADEPTSNLDPQAASEIATVFRNLSQDKNITVVVVVHQLSLLPLFGGRVVGLKNGRVEFDRLISDCKSNEIEKIYQLETS